MEIGYSARNAAEWDKLAEALLGFELVGTSADHLRPGRSSVYSRPSTSGGLKVPDLLIAAAAEFHDLTVLHYDADFDRIAAITG